MAGLAKVADDVIELFHGSSVGQIKKIDDSGVFGGIFASPSEKSALSHGQNITRFEIPKEKILTQYHLDYEADYKNIEAFLKNQFPDANDEEIEAIHKAIVEDKGFYSSSLEENRILELLGEDSIGEAGWQGQKIRGKLAKSLGFDAVEMADEHGVSYLLLPSVSAKDKQVTSPAVQALLGGAGFGAGESMAYSNDLLGASPKTPEWQASNAPPWMHSLGYKLLDIELPGQIKPFEGIGEYLINTGYPDSFKTRLKRAVKAGADFL